MIISGMVTNAPAAMVAHRGIRMQRPEKRAMATVTGSVAVVESWRVTNSFHVVINAIIAVVNSAGAASGNKMRRKACLVAPSTRAASSTPTAIA